MLAWKIPWTEEPGGLKSQVRKSQTWLSTTTTMTSPDTQCWYYKAYHTKCWEIKLDNSVWFKLSKKKKKKRKMIVYKLAQVITRVPLNAQHLPLVRRAVQLCLHAIWRKLFLSPWLHHGRLNWSNYSTANQAYKRNSCHSAHRRVVLASCGMRICNNSQIRVQVH